MLTENEKKERIKQANIQWRTRQPEASGKGSKEHPNYRKDYLKEWNEKHPNYMKDYLKEWRSRNSEKQRQYKEIWNKNHSNCMKEGESDVTGINAGSTTITVEYDPQTRGSVLIRVPIVKRLEDVDLAVVSDLDKDIYREIDEIMRKELVSRRDTKRAR